MFWCFFLFSFVCIFQLKSEPLKASTKAKCAILINADSGAILYEKNKDAPCFPASTTKIATLMYLLEKKPQWNASIPISKQAIAMVPAHLKKKNMQAYPPYILEDDGSMLGVKEGQSWPLETLLYGLMLESGNDTANALAEFCCGTIEQFMHELNGFIESDLKLKNTYFCNPHGLHYPDHVTTASDLSKITQYALRHPKFREIVQATHFEPDGTLNLKTFVQHNRLLKRGHYFYSKAIGVKTGYHSHAGHNLVAAAEHEGRCLIAVLMGYDDPNERYKDAMALFEKAFKEKKLIRTFFAKECDLFSHTIPKADKILNARLSDDIKLEYFPSEEPKLHSSIFWHPLTLPIEKGSIVGDLKLLDDNHTLVLSTPIFAEEKVEKKFFFRVLDLLKNHYFLAGLMEAALVAGLILYFRKRRVNKPRHSSKDKSSGRA